VGQGLKFLAAGITAATGEFIVFAVLHSAFGVPLVAANILSFCVGLSISFTLNKNWSFGSNDHTLRTSYQLGAYTLVAAVNVLLSSLLLKQLVAWGLVAMLAKAMVMAAVASWNFVLYKHVIFRGKRPGGLSLILQDGL
jgi:putative flippase GtrA